MVLITIAFLFSYCERETLNDDNNDKTKTGPAGNVINDIFIDDFGVKWFATDKGLSSYDDNEWKIHDVSNLGNVVLEDIVFEESSYGKEMWIASHAGATVATYTVDGISSATTYTTSNSDIAGNVVKAVGVDTFHRRWFGTDAGVSSWKGSEWEKYSVGNEEITGIGSVNPWVYVTTKGGGVHRFEETVDGISSASTLTSPWNISSDVVYCVFVDKEAKVWYGTDRGAVKQGENPKDYEAFVNYGDVSIASDTVYSIGQDPDGNMWFGTHEGVSIFDGINWLHYTETDGLVNNEVISIAFEGTVAWLGTRAGISRFDGSSWEKFTSE